MLTQRHRPTHPIVGRADRKERCAAPTLVCTVAAALLLVSSDRVFGASIRSDGSQPNDADAVVALNPMVVDTPRGGNAVEFTVQNNTGQAVTAWAVTVECTYSDGSRKRQTLAREGYSAYMGMSPDRERFIPPKAMTRASILFPTKDGLGIVSVRAAFRWAIFADGTGIGDPSGRADQFRERDREFSAWATVLAALKAGKESGSGTEALQVALNRLNARDQDDFDHPVKRNMRRNLELAIERGSMVGASDQLLRRWEVRAQQQMEAVGPHRRRPQQER